MSKFNAGDRVRIRSWESMQKEFGLAATGSVDCARRFTSGMKTLCGETAIIRKIWGNGDVELGDWSCENMDVNWQFSVDMIEPTSNATSIHITTDGKTTHAVLKEGGKVSKRAKAVCSPYDEFDFNTGARIAFDRLCTSLAENSAFKGVREVKRQAKVGEWVKIVKDCPDPDSTLQYSVGDILKITHFEDGFPQYGVGFSEYLIDSEYVVLEGYTPEPEKPQYYNGKVVCVDASLGFTPGKVYAFKDGMTVDDDGDVRPGDWRLEKLEDYLPTNRFIEFKGEA